jgi:hypothetical protein
MSTSLAVADAAYKFAHGTVKAVDGSELGLGATHLLRQAVEWGLLRSLKGETIVLTGKMTLSRKAMSTLIATCGGSVSNAFSGATTTLVMADGPTSGTGVTNKLQAARRAGTLILKESEFVASLMARPGELEAGKGLLPFSQVAEDVANAPGSLNWWMTPTTQGGEVAPPF